MGREEQDGIFRFPGGENSETGREAFPVRVVLMTEARLEEVAALERICFPDPWSRRLLAEELNSGFCTCLTALDSRDRVAGYAFLRAVLDEGSVDNIAVRPDCRRRGVAGRLLKALLRIAAERRLAFLTLEVRASNAAAIALYESRGFHSVGRRRNYYDNPPEDALLMTAALSGGGQDGGA